MTGMHRPPDCGDEPIGGDADAVRALLIAQREGTVQQAEGLARAFDEFVESAEFVATDDEHDPEGHTIAFERQQIAGLLREARARLVDLDRAIAACDAGTYGRCAHCGRPIAPQRLIALPATRTCIDCARAATG
jgi:RNA polymerase-binding transcription factor DksA